MLFMKLTADLNAARIARNSGKVKLLSTLIGELQRDLQKHLPDEKVIKTIKKFIEGSQDMLKHSTNEELKVQAQYEISVLSDYLPVAVSKEELEAIVAGFKSANPDAEVSALMNMLKDFKAQSGKDVDMGLASKLFKG